MLAVRMTIAVSYHSWQYKCIIHDCMYTLHAYVATYLHSRALYLYGHYIVHSKYGQVCLTKLQIHQKQLQAFAHVTLCDQALSKTFVHVYCMLAQREGLARQTNCMCTKINLAVCKYWCVSAGHSQHFREACNIEILGVPWTRLKVGQTRSTQRGRKQ